MDNIRFLFLKRRLLSVTILVGLLFTLGSLTAFALTEAERQEIEKWFDCQPASGYDSGSFGGPLPATGPDDNTLPLRDSATLDVSKEFKLECFNEKDSSPVLRAFSNTVTALVIECSGAPTPQEVNKAVTWTASGAPSGSTWG